MALFTKVYERWLEALYRPVVENAGDLEDRLSTLEKSYAKNVNPYGAPEFPESKED